MKIQSYLLSNSLVGYSSEVNNENREAPKSYISGNRIQINRFYTKKICKIATYALSRNDMAYDEALNPIDFNGYRAVIEFNIESKQGRFAPIIGGAVIEIISENMENEKILMEAANKIDVEKTIKYFGK